MDISQLHTLSLQGDTQAEEQLFRAISVRFMRIAALKIGNRQDVEEVVQEALAVVLKKYRNLDQKVKFVGWCHKVLHYQILGYYRKKYSHAYRQEDFNGLHHMEITWQPDLEFRDRLLTCLEKMNKKSKKYIRIINFHYQGYTPSEICSKLGITKDYYYVILMRARSMLAQCLESDGDL